MLVEKSFDTSEAVLNYAEGPENGPPLLFLHGGVGHWRSYDEMLPAFTDRYHVFALDFRGRGRSTRMGDAINLKNDVDDASKFIAECIGEASNVFGHSLGGWVAIWCANLIPGLVRSIIIFDPPLDLHRLIERFSSEEARKALVRNRGLCGKPVEETYEALRSHLPWRDRTVRVFAEAYSLCDPKWFDPWIGDDSMDYFDGFEVDEFLKGIGCPALLIQADPQRGGEISDKDVRRVMSVNPAIAHVQISGIGHDFDDVERLIEETTGFLGSLR
ncbi:MAG: alpha/beta hydrolase [Candidatus Bathyarchaeota archaeon]|nr:MAG: alpha/beta hydrolase [Candidatus Bathyarchaeota archaeon]